MDCIFCKIVEGGIKSEKVFESENFIVIKDANPKVKGHSLVIPKEHIETFFELPESLYGELIRVAKKSAEILGNEGSSTGFNFIVNNGASAGQIIHHAHLHILPRKESDGFRVNV
ncbi:MAG: HIT family protein [Candidatus Pacearchaeota archaeon]